MHTPPRYISGALALLMSGCAYYDHFDNRVGRYDVVAAQSRDGMILTNVIRASHAEPLSFVQLGQINGSAPGRRRWDCRPWCLALTSQPLPAPRRMFCRRRRSSAPTRPVAPASSAIPQYKRFDEFHGVAIGEQGFLSRPVT